MAKQRRRGKPQVVNGVRVCPVLGPLKVKALLKRLRPSRVPRQAKDLRRSAANAARRAMSKALESRFAGADTVCGVGGSSGAGDFSAPNADPTQGVAAPQQHNPTNALTLLSLAPAARLVDSETDLLSMSPVEVVRLADFVSESLVVAELYRIAKRPGVSTQEEITALKAVGALVQGQKKVAAQHLHLHGENGGRVRFEDELFKLAERGRANVEGRGVGKGDVALLEAGIAAGDFDVFRKSLNREFSKQGHTGRDEVLKGGKVDENGKVIEATVVGARNVGKKK